MCGICAVFSVAGDKSTEGCSAVESPIEESRLWRRGPDKKGVLSRDIAPGLTSWFWGFTLHFRGELTPQPLKDSGDNILLWNGEIFGGIQVDGGMNDGAVLLAKLGTCTSDAEVLEIIQKIEGPWAIIYWQESAKKLWFGRDIFGRRSLLIHMEENGSSFALSSVITKNKDWVELPAHGLYCLQIPSVTQSLLHSETVLYPWAHGKDDLDLDRAHGGGDSPEVAVPTLKLSGGVQLPLGQANHQMVSSIPSFNTSLPPDDIPLVNTNSENSKEQGTSTGSQKVLILTDFATTEHLVLADQFITVLGEAVHKRVEAQSVLCGLCLKNYLSQEHPKSDSFPPSSSDLNIPGKDCKSLREHNQFTPCSHSRVAILFSGGIDSLVIAALADKFVPQSEPIDLLNVAFEQKTRPTSGNKTKGVPVQPEDPYAVPDRVTGRNGLKLLNPARKWNFIEVNVTLDQLQQARDAHVQELLSPLRTVLDDSIGCAIWFAARGRGELTAEGVKGTPYNSTARVVLVGMGADEQLAGYSRHRVKFNTGGWAGLVEEVKMEIERISSRNLGRDDRIITDHGKEARFPFLDEQVVSFLNTLPLWQKANLTLPRGVGEKFLLRLAATKLGLEEAATLPKRAIQFGSRIAKMENRKEKASDICTRLPEKIPS